MAIQAIVQVNKESVKKKWFVKQNDSNGLRKEVETILAIERQTRNVFSKIETLNYLTCMRRNNLMVGIPTVENGTGNKIIVYKKGEKIKALRDVKEAPADAQFKLTYNDAQGIYYFEGKI